jgi:hypothetical protein
MNNMYLHEDHLFTLIIYIYMKDMHLHVNVYLHEEQVFTWITCIYMKSMYLQV